MLRVMYEVKSGVLACRSDSCYFTLITDDDCRPGHQNIQRDRLTGCCCRCTVLYAVCTAPYVTVALLRRAARAKPVPGTVGRAVVVSTASTCTRTELG